MSAKQTAGADFKKALAAVRQKNTQVALEWIKKARDGHSELPPAEILLAKLCLEEGDRGQAQDVLEQAAVLYPKDPETHLIFADLAWRDHRLTDAHLQYERANSLVKKWKGDKSRKLAMEAWAMAGLGSVAETRGQLDLALKYFSTVLKLQPDHPQARFRVGNIEFAMGRIDSALKSFQTAAEENPAMPPPTLVIANLYRNAGDNKNVEVWLQKAMDQEPMSAAPVVLMARFQLLEQNNPKQTLKYIDQAEQLGGTLAETKLLKGLSAWHLGNLKTAEKDLEALALKEPGNVLISSHLAAVLAEQGDAKRLERASELANMTAATNQQSVDIATTVGWIAFLQGDLDRAEQQLKAVMRTPNPSRDAKYYLARVLIRRGQMAAAKQILEQTLNSKGLFIHLRQAKKWDDEISGK